MSRLFSGRRLGVRGWFHSAVGGMAALVVLFSVVGGVLLGQASQASDTLVDRLAPARAALAAMEGALVDEETGVRGYLLTRDPSFLQPYTEGEAEDASDAGQVRSLLAGDPAALADLATVQRSIAAWRQDYAEPFIAAARSGGGVDQARLAASKTAFDRLRGQFLTVDNLIDQERTSAMARLAHLDRVRDWAFIAMLAAFLVAVCLLVLLVHGAVLRPLNRLRWEAEAVKEDTFDAVITSTGPRDIRALSASLDAMRKRLTRALAATEKQRAALHRQKETLDAQAVELRRSNEELEQFAYVASHDLQEPLRKVASFCQLIEKRYGEVLDERGKQYIDYAVDGAKRMQVLINDLLTFSRVGRVNDRKERVELHQVLGTAMDSLQYVIEESRAVVRVVDGPLPAVVGDPTLLGMLLQNVVGNSLKFRAPGRAPEVEIATAPDPGQEGFVRVSVTDNGIGVPEEFAEKVFVIFQRLHSREAYAGTGIGLALCKKIVEHHGGHIRIEPGREVGTRLSFSLPLAEPAPVAPEPAGPAEPAERIAQPVVAAADSGDNGGAVEDVEVAGEAEAEDAVGAVAAPSGPGIPAGPGTGRPAEEGRRGL